MNRCNFSLISALYDSKDSGFYHDIYFPIIKYGIVELLRIDRDKQFYTLDMFRDKISDLFGVKIPKPVLKRVIQQIEKRNDISLTLYENGEQFKVERAWDVSINENIDLLSSKFQGNLELLEEEYTKYKESTGMDNDLHFVDFISANTEDILGYFEAKDETVLNERFAPLASFLKSLYHENTDLFRAANELFWGSVIAAFLTRDDTDNLQKTQEGVEYFLDTNLIMALIGLSTTEHEEYAAEFLSIMKAGGGIPRVHPITIREVTNIIQSVEVKQDAWPFTEIGDAYERKKLTPSKLAQIRCKLPQTLERLGVSIFPMCGDNDLEKKIRSYARNNKVIQLSEERKSGKEDAFRDIHDVFMCEYVDERCKVKNAEKCFFVTYNIGLIKMGNNWMKHNEQLLIHPGKVVVELWMHDVNFTNSRMKNSALTESIARCLTLNNKDVLRKLEVVSHYYNQDSPDFDVKTYQEIYKSLVRRSQGVVDYVDEILENEQTDKKELNQELMKNLLAEVKEQTALCEAVTSKFRKESEATTTLLQQEVDILKQSVHTQGKTIHSFKQKNEDQETKIMRLINESANLKDENKKLQAENNLRKREALLGSQIKKLQLENGYLNSKRNKSVSYFYYYFTYILMLLALSTILAFGILHLLNLNVVILSWLTGGGAVILVGWVFCIWKNEPDVFMCKVFKEKIYQKQVEVWDRKHPEYKENCDELETLSSELNEIRSKLNNL